MRPSRKPDPGRGRDFSAFVLSRNTRRDKRDPGAAPASVRCENIRVCVFFIIILIIMVFFFIIFLKMRPLLLVPPPTPTLDGAVRPNRTRTHDYNPFYRRPGPIILHAILLFSSLFIIVVLLMAQVS